MSHNNFMNWFKPQFDAIVASVDAAYDEAVEQDDWAVYEYAHDQARQELTNLYNNGVRRGCTQSQLEYITSECEIAGYNLPGVYDGEEVVCA